VVHHLTAIEHYLRSHLGSEIDRRRLDRGKRFVEETARRGGGEVAHRMNARWLKFLCSQAPVQTDVWPEDGDFLRHFAAAFDLPPDKRREFVGLSLLGRIWRAWYFDDLAKGPPELVARLTRATGWEHFDRCRQDGAGLILVPVHTQFARLLQPYLRHRGHAGLEVGITHDKLDQQGLRTPVAKQFELARQMHAGKQLLSRGGIVFNPPDARQNLDNSRPVEFFGRQRQLAAGFAELALKTGAHVVPVSYRFTSRGSFVLEFGPPLDALGPQSTHDERVDALVAQYASFLRDQWRNHLWNIPWNHLLHYCLLPEADPAARGENAISPRAQALPQ
jgi:hypothetical protein